MATVDSGEPQTVLADLELTHGLTIQMTALGTLGLFVAVTILGGLYQADRFGLFNTNRTWLFDANYFGLLHPDRPGLLDCEAVRRVNTDRARRLRTERWR